MTGRRTFIPALVALVLTVFGVTMALAAAISFDSRTEPVIKCSTFTEPDIAQCVNGHTGRVYATYDVVPVALTQCHSDAECERGYRPVRVSDEDIRVDCNHDHVWCDDEGA